MLPFLSTLVAVSSAAASADSLGLVPRPESIRRESGEYQVTPDVRVSVSRGLEGEAEYLRQVLSPGTGFSLATTRGKGAIALRLDRKLAKLGDEGYRLWVRPTGVEIRAYKPAGVFYGIQTLRQLFPAWTLRRAAVRTEPISLPLVEIEDQPRFAWRGLHLDVARHFMPKEFVLKYIDLLAFHKMNTLHWHLTEDQGWRLEIKKYPKLTSVGAWRKDDMITYSPATYTGKPHGGFYTQEDAKEVVAYAAARHITVVPEIEMPGHAQAAISAYPEFGEAKVPLEVWTMWGVSENVYNTDDKTLAFLRDVLDEVLAIFPSKFIHIGGDEVPKTQWKASASAQAKMKSLGLKNEEELQSWFIHQIDRYLTEKGRRTVGWDEILEGGLAPGATVMSWRGEDGGIAAAKAGHDVIMAPNGWTYLDAYQSRDRAKEPHAIGGFLPLEKVYGYDPIPASLTAEEARHVLGAQGQLWTEYIPNPKHLEYMAYPRACALSEVVWSPKEGKSYPGFSSRMSLHAARLKALDVAFRPLD